MKTKDTIVSAVLGLALVGCAQIRSIDFPTGEPPLQKSRIDSWESARIEQKIEYFAERFWNAVLMNDEWKGSTPWPNQSIQSAETAFQISSYDTLLSFKHLPKNDEGEYALGAGTVKHKDHLGNEIIDEEIDVYYSFSSSVGHGDAGSVFIQHFEFHDREKNYNASVDVSYYLAQSMIWLSLHRNDLKTIDYAVPGKLNLPNYSNKAVDTTATNARLLDDETSKSTIPDVEAKTEAAVVSP